MHTIAVLAIDTEDLVELGLNTRDLLSILYIRGARCFDESMLLLLANYWRA